MRIAKYIANAGYCSKRQAERHIMAKEVSVNDTIISTPALTISSSDVVKVKDRVISALNEPRLWLYHKPKGQITTHNDPQGRKTVFESLPSHIPRVISVGRLDYNTEGLLLLTNNGSLARTLELPSTGLVRKYKCRVFGVLKSSHVAVLAEGMVVDGIHYRGMNVVIQKKQGANLWLEISLTEGKNREIKKLLACFNVVVNRLIRIEYGKFKLNNLKCGETLELDKHQFSKYISNKD